MYQILIVDDHPILLEALATSVAGRYVDATVIQAASFAECLALLNGELELDLILYDLNLGDHQGIDGLQSVRLLVPEVPVLVISADQDKQTILDCLSAGAAGFVLKSQPSAAMLQAVELVLAGQIYFPDLSQDTAEQAQAPLFTKQQLAQLTKKQLEVLVLIAEGYANKDICDRLCVAETTVKTHVSDILRKLGVKNRTQAALGLNKVVLKTL